MTQVSTGNNTGLPDATKIADVADVNGEKVQRVQLDILAGAGAAPNPITAANPLPVTQAGVAQEGAKITSENLEAGGSSVLGWLSSIRKAITDRLNTLGQKAMASSTPVVIASDQSNVGIKDSSGNPITATPLGQATMANSLPVALASNQTALPVSASSLPLPTGAATETTLAAINTATGAQADAEAAGNGSVIAILKRLRTLLGGTLGISGSVSVSNFPATQPVSAVSLPLPTGAATETTLAAINTAHGAQADAEATGNGSLIAILKRIRTLLGWGQRAVASSISVAIATEQDLSAPISATGTLGALAATVSLTLTGQRHVSIALVGALSFNGKISVDYQSLNGEWETRFFHSGDGLVAEDKLPPGTGANRRNYNLATMPGDLQVRVRVSGYTSGSMTAWLRASNTKDWGLTCNIPQPYRTLDTVIGALNAGIVVIPFGPDVGFMVEAGTFAGTLGIDGSYDDGLTWGALNLPFRDLTNDMTRTSLVLTNPNSFVAISVPVPNGITYVRMIAKAYTSGSFVAMAASRPESGVIRVASGVADSVGSGALGALNAAVTVSVQGQASVGFAIDAGTLAGSVLVESSNDGGANWIGALFNDGARWRVAATPMVFTNPNPATQIDVPVTSAATHVRLRVSVYTSGTANARGKACQISPALSLAITAGVSGVATPFFAGRIAGDNGANLQAIAALTTTPAATDAGIVTREVPHGLPISLSINESVAAPTAATWYLKRQWAIPATQRFRPTRVMSQVTTAASRSMVVVGQKLGTFNVSTNVFTDGGSVASPRHYSRLFAIVTTVLSATPTDVTVTYTDDLGNAGHTTAALTIPASAPVGNAFEFVLANTTGQMKDNGVRDVTAISDTAAPTGVIEIWGVNVLHDALGVATAAELSSVADETIDSTESILILLQQAATTAQQRGVTVNGYML